MYLPTQFALADLDALQTVIAANPFATLVTTGPEGLGGDHLPLPVSYTHLTLPTTPYV